MAKRLTRFFLVFLAAGILFTACPIAYTPPDPPSLTTPGAGWRYHVHIPPGFGEDLTGTAPGFQWWQFPYPGRNFMPTAGRLVTVTFSFDNGVMTGVVVCVENESEYYVEGGVTFRVDTAVKAWEDIVNEYGIQAIPRFLPMNQVTPMIPNREEWEQWEIDTFAGATITINALYRAAYDALGYFVQFPECETQGCTCTPCPGANCNCVVVPSCAHANCACTPCPGIACTCGVVIPPTCGYANCTCTPCPGIACTCDAANLPDCETQGCACVDCPGVSCTCVAPQIKHVTGESGGFWFYEGYPYMPLAISYVSVTFTFSNGTLTALSTFTGFETASYAYDPVLEWEARVLAGGTQAIPLILASDTEYPARGDSFHAEWPGGADGPYVDAFAGGTFTINGLTRAAHNALRTLPQGFLPPEFFPPGFSPAGN